MTQNDTKGSEAMDKEWYTISEMVKLGHTRAQLNQFVHSIYSRNIAYRTSPKGKWKINKTKYERWVMCNTV